jgi:hypothetical protein
MLKRSNFVKVHMPLGNDKKEEFRKGPYAFRGCLKEHFSQRLVCIFDMLKRLNFVEASMHMDKLKRNTFVNALMPFEWVQKM